MSTKTLREPPGATGPGRPGVPLWRLVGWFVQRQRQESRLKLEALRRGGDGASLAELEALEAGVGGLSPRSMQDVALALKVPTVAGLVCQALLCVAEAPAMLRVTWTTEPSQCLAPLYAWGDRRDPRRDDGPVALVDAPPEAVRLVGPRDLALRVRGTRARQGQLALPLAVCPLVALLVRGADLVNRGMPDGAVVSPAWGCRLIRANLGCAGRVKAGSASTAPVLSGWTTWGRSSGLADTHRCSRARSRRSHDVGAGRVAPLVTSVTSAKDHGDHHFGEADTLARYNPAL